LRRSIAFREQDKARARVRAFFESQNPLKSDPRLYGSRKQSKADDRSAQCARTGSDER
jgi:hypothetical protein